MLKNNTIGNILKEARKLKGYTQQQLADKYLSDRQLISNYERNISIPNAESFVLLLDILGTTAIIKDGEVKIMEVKNNMKQSKDLRIEFLNFDFNSILEDYYKEREEMKRKYISKSEEVEELAKTKGLEAYYTYGFTDSMWHVNCSKDGVVFSISKDNKEIQVEVEKSGCIDIFDLETFIKDIEENSGKGVAQEIYKIITFDAYTYSMGKDIFELFNSISKGIVTEEDAIPQLLPMTNEFKSIIFNQLKSKDYVEKIYELNLPETDIPVSYLLDIYDEIQSNNIWVKLVLDDYDEVYEPESFDTGLIIDACEYAVNIFDRFDELFGEWQE